MWLMCLNYFIKFYLHHIVTYNKFIIISGFSL